jgi:hypothetical protein
MRACLCLCIKSQLTLESGFCCWPAVPCVPRSMLYMSWVLGTHIPTDYHGCSAPTSFFSRVLQPRSTHGVGAPASRWLHEFDQWKRLYGRLGNRPLSRYHYWVIRRLSLACCEFCLRLHLFSSIYFFFNTHWSRGGFMSMGMQPPPAVSNYLQICMVANCRLI